MMAGDTSFELDIQGKGGHGAMPQYANNPINYIQKVIEEIDNIARINDAIITPTVVNGGSSYNVIPDRISIKGTCRFLTKTKGDNIVTQMSNLKMPNISIQCKMIPGYPPTINNIDCASL